MLEGLDSEWQFTKGSNNHLSYANLPVGEYVLRIKGTNSDKLWSNNEVQLKIKVLPPFFRSQLAYLIYALVLLIAIMLTVWYYVKRTEKRQKERIKRLNDEKEKFYQEVVFSDNAPDISAYKEYYESIEPEKAEEIYKQVVEQLQEDEQIKSYASTYSSMKAKQAAAIFDTMTDDLPLVGNILWAMDAQSRGDILGAMNADTAAAVTKLMEP